MLLQYLVDKSDQVSELVGQDVSWGLKNWNFAFWQLFFTCLSKQVA